MDKEKKGPIGVFDSGFGGIDILRDLVQKLPEHSFIYLGDTARAPYGTRTQQAIHQFTKQGVRHLFDQGCPLVVLACNTASSQALPLFENRKKIVGIIRPTVEAVLEKTPRRVGVLATEATVRSNAFPKEIEKVNPRVEVFQSPAPLLVPIVEEGEQASIMAQLAVKRYLTPLVQKKIDTLILGCTHFGILEPAIKKEAGESIRVIKEGPVMARALKSLLTDKPELDKKIKKEGKVVFYTTDLTDRFLELGSGFFGKKIEVEKIKL